MEKCPLSGGGQAIDSLPDICHKNCFDLWEEALGTQVGEIDDYSNSLIEEPEGCGHFNVAFSHEGLQAVDASPRRTYTIVDKCEDCNHELLETCYTFQCPND